ncbi:MAG: glycosyltransferase [Candidatus Thorarchaeota archaeon]
MADYVLATKFYNEEDSLPGLISNIAEQNLRPKVFVFVDDGSVDSSADIAIETAKEKGLDHRLVSMPKKEKGNLDTLGRAWNKAQPLLKDLASEVKYFATTDVDTTFPKQYFQQIIRYLEDHPMVGAVSGQIDGSFIRSFPMFTGKVVKSEVIKYIDKYWDISIDSFLNIKALKLGFETRVLDNMLVQSPPSHLESGKGRYRSGRLAFYAGIGPIYAISKALMKLDTLYLRGYWSEFSRGNWRCEDKDVQDYYQNEFKRKLLSFSKRVFNI